MLYEHKNALSMSVPEFFRIWLAAQDPNDPQLSRWCEYESKQLSVGRRMIETFRRFFPLQAKTALDVGCQWGATSIAMARAGAQVTGVDVVEDFVKGARVRAEQQGVNATFHVAPAEQLPFDDQAFDIVVCVNVLEHVDCHRRTIEEMARVLRPGGFLYVDGPNRFSPSWLWKDPHYGMLGISILPQGLGRLYVTRLRGYPAYHVGVFPVASRIKRLLQNSGIEVLAFSRRSSTGSKFTIGSSFPGFLGLSACQRLLAFNTSPMFFLVGQKVHDQEPTNH